MKPLVNTGLLVSLALGTPLFGLDQTATYGKCSIDLGAPVLPKCAVEMRNGQLFVLRKFAEDVFAGRVHGLAANPLRVGRDRLASIWLDEGKWSYYDETGRVLVQNVAPADNAPSEFQDGLVPVAKDGKWGLADSKGKFVVPLKFDGMAGAEGPGWLVCSGCREVHKGEHSWFSGGHWFRLDAKGRVAGEAKDPSSPTCKPSKRDSGGLEIQLSKQRMRKLERNG
jgi:hypothetical protein